MIKAMADQVFTDLIVYPEILITKTTKLIPRKCLMGNVSYLDLRLHQKYPNQSGYLRTKKGLFLPEETWLNSIFPFLHKVFTNGNCNTSQNPEEKKL